MSGETREIIVVLDHDVLERHALAAYLDECGYGVVGVGSTEESLDALATADEPVVAVLCRTDAVGELTASELASRIRAEHQIQVLLADSLERKATIAGELCDEVPEIGRPHDPAVLVDEIRRRIAEEGEG